MYLHVQLILAYHPHPLLTLKSKRLEIKHQEWLTLQVYDRYECEQKKHNFNFMARKIFFIKLGQTENQQMGLTKKWEDSICFYFLRLRRHQRFFRLLFYGNFKLWQR